jgi:hypothetical protein
MSEELKHNNRRIPKYSKIYSPHGKLNLHGSYSPQKLFTSATNSFSQIYSTREKNIPQPYHAFDGKHIHHNRGYFTTQAQYIPEFHQMESIQKFSFPRNNSQHLE